VAARIETRESAGPSAGRSWGSGVPVDRSSFVASSCPASPRKRGGSHRLGVARTKLPLRPREMMSPTSESACQAWLTVAGLIFRSAASSLTVGRRSPGARSPELIILAIVVAIPCGVGSSTSGATGFIACPNARGLICSRTPSMFAPRSLTQIPHKCLRSKITQRVSQWRST
jgi:hypothetical protein